MFARTGAYILCISGMLIIVGWVVMRGGFGDRCDRVFTGLLAIRCSGKEYGLIVECPARMVGN